MSDAIRAAAALAARKLSYKDLYSLQYKLIVEYVSGHDVLPFFPSAMEKACATGVCLECLAIYSSLRSHL